MHKRHATVAALTAALASVLLAACGGGGDGSTTPASYTVQGTVSGLSAGTQLVLDDNGGDALTVAGNGSFTFATAVVAGGSYAVTVGTQPVGETCTVTSGAGSGVSADVANVSVACSVDTYSIGGTVAGLASGTSVTLDDNGGDPAVVSADGSFTFATPLNYNSSYLVTVATQPTGQTCTVSAPSGAGLTANIANVSVICSADDYVVGGTLSGLSPGAEVTLDDQGSGPIGLSANGAFVFTTRVAYGGSYAVTVGFQPTDEVCTVANGSGSGVTGDVGTVTVTCSVDAFAVGGAVSGLPTGTQLTLNDNGGDALVVAANGSFVFPTAVALNGNYNVTVATQPTGATCTVSNGTGSSVTAAVSNVSVVCSTQIGHAYVATYAGAIAEYSIGANGLLTSLSPSTVYPASGSTITAVSASPTGRFLYANNGEILQYDIDPTTGVISPMATPVVEGNCNNGSFFGCSAEGPLRIDKAGHYAYIAGGTSGISQFTVDQTTGSLTLVAGTPSFSTANGPAEIVLEASGRYAYVNDTISDTIAQYAIGADGTLTPLSPPAVAVTGGGSDPHTMTAHPTGPYIYVMSYEPGLAGAAVSQYVIGTGGALAPIGAGFVTLTGNNPLGMAIDPQGRYAYVADSGSNFLSQFTIGADGSLTPMSVPTVATGNVPYDVSVDPSGHYVYVANYEDGTVSQYAIGSTGALTPLVPATIRAAVTAISITVTPF